MTEVYTAACPYCGQTMTISQTLRPSEEDLERMAVMQCNCDAARYRQKVQKKYDIATGNIFTLFGEDGPEMIECLGELVKQIAEGRFAKASIVNADGVKASLTGKADSIKIERTVTEKKVLDE